MYKPTLIKDKLPNVEGEKFGPIDLETYTRLYEDGYIEDELGLIKAKKQKNKKPKENNFNNV